MDKTEETLERWRSAEGIHFESAEAEDDYKKRAKRIADALQLKVPDRVPVELTFGIFPALYAGFTAEEALFDISFDLEREVLNLKSITSAYFNWRCK